MGWGSLAQPSPVPPVAPDGFGGSVGLGGHLVLAAAARDGGLGAVVVGGTAHIEPVA